VIVTGIFVTGRLLLVSVAVRLTVVPVSVVVGLAVKVSVDERATTVTSTSGLVAGTYVVVPSYDAK
jgi:hypothetical protein